MKINLNIRNRYLLLGDLFLSIVSVVGAYILRLELIEVFSNYYLSLLWLLLLSLTIKPIIYYLFGLYQKMWVYASVRELKLILIAVSVSSFVNTVIMLILFANRFFVSFPRSVLVIDWILSILFVGGLRFGLRVLFEGNKNRAVNKHINIIKKHSLIIGAGDMGAMVAREFQKNPLLKTKPIGFLDDNPEKYKQQLHGIPVIGRLKDLSKAIKTYQVNEVIISIPSASGGAVREIINICRKNKIPFRTMPGIYELIGGSASVTRLREVEISDLLKRPPTKINEDLVGNILEGKTILVTGAGGSIGQELCRQIARWSPAKMVLLGHGENSIFESFQILKEYYPSLPVVTSIADIRDASRIDQEFSRNKPQVVFHTAAHKHVPLMEINVEDCILNNVLGTQNIIQACEKANVERLVLISTDKAIMPVSVMGASKRLAEMLVLNAARRTQKPFSVVRFGNVLGSRGSVVPLFKRQIAKGGPVTVTHPDMKRYFMTIPEAVYLVLQSAGMGKGGETFVLDMGEQIKIVNLAEDLIRLSGFEPRKDIDIVFTGIRDGEKLSEDLWNDDRKLSGTDHPEISREEGQVEIQGKELEEIVENLVDLSRQGQGDKIIDFLNKIINNADIKHNGTENLSDFDL
ncbi:MAG: nucleoside-diphosphate sugar epimerase/dehydratase [Pelolinea sp.]|nr:nucleoside-diphosphate sugar epimerase/dehydratase [Pelolinea sp.]